MCFRLDRFLKLMIFSVSMVFGLSMALAATSKTSLPVTRTKAANSTNVDTAATKPSTASVVETPQDETSEDGIPRDERPVGYATGELSTSSSSTTGWRRSKETKFAYKLGTGFDSFANEREQAQIYGFGLGADFKAQISDPLSVRVKGGAVISNGYAQSRFGDNIPKTGFFLDEGYVNLRLFNSSFARATVSAGGFDQGVYNSEIFIAHQAFPGVQEALHFGSSKVFKVKIWAQQAIPTSKTLSTKTVDAEVTPSFTTETAEIKVKPSEYFEFETAVTHFTFNNLPSAVATESVLYGNSVDEVGPNTSRFKYRFDGMLAFAEARVKFTPRYSVWTSGSLIQNAAAPEGYRNGQLLKAGFDIGLPGEIDLKPWGGVFFVEDDAVPGFYNTSSSGHNNRQGYVLTLESFFQRQRFKLKTQFMDADLINRNIYQSRQQTLSIGFETFYEML